MIGNAVPSHTRRTYGRICVVVASLVVGFSVWAAQPATAIRVAVEDPAPNTQSAASTLAKYPVRIRFSGTGVKVERGDGFTRVAGAEFQLLIASEVRVQFQSDSVSEGSGGSRTLEGHVSITASRSSDRATSANAQPVIANVSATKAVVTPESGGGFKVRVEHGSVILRHEDGSDWP